MKKVLKRQSSGSRVGRNKMKILITTGIYPPKIGGPAQYAKNLKSAFEAKGHEVRVKTFSIEDYLPSGLRHLYFFVKIIPVLIRSEVVFVLDTFSVGLPTILAAKIFGKVCIIRTGGDFLWEQYVERTQKKVPLRSFYETERSNFSVKEKIIFWLTKWTLRNVTHTIFSTNWQREIFIEPYGMKRKKTSIVENYYCEKEADLEPSSKEFIGSTRKLTWKNIDILQSVFVEIKRSHPEVELFLENMPYGKLMERLKESYAVILVSIGDISPNMMLDAIRFNRPFICTKEVGIYDRIKDAGTFVDPYNKEEIKNAVLNLLTKEGYREAKQKVQQFNFVHTWEQIADEFLATYKNLNK